MNKKLTNTLLITLATVFITSCSIQKRYHHKGWNIEWNQARNTSVHAKNADSRNIEKKTALLSAPVLQDIPHSTGQISPAGMRLKGNSPSQEPGRPAVVPVGMKLNKLNPPKSGFNTVHQIESAAIPKPPTRNIRNIITPKNEDKRSDEPAAPTKKVVHWAAILGLALSVLGFPTYGLLAIPGIIICLVAMLQIEKKPSKYKGKRLAKVGLAIGITAIAFWLAVLTVVIISL